MSSLRIPFSLLLLVLSSASLAQRITGKVFDSTTKEPIPFATVFFANSLFGTTSDIDGNFGLHGFPVGKYDLVVSHVGYSDFLVSRNFEEGEEVHIQVALEEDLIELADLHVNADTSGRDYNYELFQENFLGKTPNALKTRILNPEVLFLFFDREEKTLYAHAKEPLEIENMAMGYRISYLLKEFSFNVLSGRLYSFGIPLFSVVETSKKSTIKRWLRERQRAYEGSLPHFFKSLRKLQLEEDGFEVRELFRIPNPDRPSSGVIEGKIQYYRAEMRKRMKLEGSNTGQILIPSSETREVSDSLRYWNRMRSLPIFVDSLGQRISTGAEIVDSHSRNVEYKGLLEVKYLHEKESLGYTRMHGRRVPAKEQTSTITFLSDTLKIYDNGYYEDVKNIFIERYLSWSTNISELLPLGYLPVEND